MIRKSLFKAAMICGVAGSILITTPVFANQNDPTANPSPVLPGYDDNEPETGSDEAPSPQTGDHKPAPAVPIAAGVAFAGVAAAAVMSQKKERK